MPTIRCRLGQIDIISYLGASRLMRGPEVGRVKWPVQERTPPPSSCAPPVASPASTVKGDGATAGDEIIIIMNFIRMIPTGVCMFKGWRKNALND